MKFYSTNKNSPLVGLQEAIMRSLAPDGGLYMPTEIPKLPNKILNQLSEMSFQEIAFEVSRKYFAPDVPNKILKKIISNAFDFKIPLKEIDKNIFALELFYGPTCAFKDFAARFMAGVFGYFANESQREITLLVSTSGDTGSAIAHGFQNIKGIKVIILYPSGKVSALQEKQLTSMGGNVRALEVEGTFDDCQKIVKQAFLNKDLKNKFTLASANSINIARLLPQTFYYFYLCAKLQKKNKPILVSVPSGNFGNLTAGLIAKKMGAPISKFIASTNSNDAVPKYLQTGKFKPSPSVSTISNAMDVGSPSNFARMLDLYENDFMKMKQDILGVSFSDKKTKDAIKKVFQQNNYIMDPHGAVAYLGLIEAQKNNPNSVGLFLETAHPAKFADVVEKIIGVKIPVPSRLKNYINRKKESTMLKNKFEDFKNEILN